MSPNFIMLLLACKCVVTSAHVKTLTKRGSFAIDKTSARTYDCNVYAIEIKKIAFCCVSVIW